MVYGCAKRSVYISKIALIVSVVYSCTVAVAVALAAAAAAAIVALLLLVM